MSRLDPKVLALIKQVNKRKKPTREEMIKISRELGQVLLEMDETQSILVDKIDALNRLVEKRTSELREEQRLREDTLRINSNLSRPMDRIRTLVRSLAAPSREPTLSEFDERWKYEEAVREYRMREDDDLIVGRLLELTENQESQR